MLIAEVVERYEAMEIHKELHQCEGCGKEYMRSYRDAPCSGNEISGLAGEQDLCNACAGTEPPYRQLDLF